MVYVTDSVNMAESLLQIKPIEEQWEKLSNLKTLIVPLAV